MLNFKNVTLTIILHNFLVDYVLRLFPLGLVSVKQPGNNIMFQY